VNDGVVIRNACRPSVWYEPGGAETNVSSLGCLGFLMSMTQKPPGTLGVSPQRVLQAPR
jgi:hypothetical protein